MSKKLYYIPGRFRMDFAWYVPPEVSTVDYFFPAFKTKAKAKKWSKEHGKSKHPIHEVLILSEDEK